MLIAIETYSTSDFPEEVSGPYPTSVSAHALIFLQV